MGIFCAGKHKIPSLFLQGGIAYDCFPESRSLSTVIYSFLSFSFFALLRELMMEDYLYQPFFSFIQIDCTASIFLSLSFIIIEYLQINGSC